MKKIYTMAAGFLLCAGLASCEMKEEIFGGGEVPSETGKVELGVSVDDKTNVVVTKAAADDEGEIQGSSVDPSDYPVEFVHQEAEYTKEYIYGDIEGTEVTLPIGEYKVRSHTEGDLEKQMTYPYYAGEIDLTVTKDVASEATVTCTMQNSRILLTYGPEFNTKFTDWTITIDDGSDKTLIFTNEMGLNPDPVYWYFGTECKEISINITANNGTIHESRKITKPDGASNPNWTGGDALTITMEPGEEDPENPSGVVGSGIKINVEAFFTTNKDEEVTVPIEGEETTDPENPDEGGDDEPETPTTGDPTITSDYLSSGITFSIAENPEWVGPGIQNKYNVVSAPEHAYVTINAAKGFESIKVRINAQGEFNTAIGLMGLTEDVDILAPDLDGTLKTLLNPPTDEDATTYSLDVAPFFSMMAWYGPTTPDTYDFVITVTDKAGKTAGPETLSVTITEE